MRTHWGAESASPRQEPSKEARRNLAFVGGMGQEKLTVATATEARPRAMVRIDTVCILTGWATKV